MTQVLAVRFLVDFPIGFVTLLVAQKLGVFSLFDLPSLTLKQIFGLAFLLMAIAP